MNTMATKVRESDWAYQGAALSYESNIAPLLALWTDQLQDKATLTPGARVLDVACGTGTVARRAAARVGPAGAVTGIDMDAGMLSVASTLAENAGLVIEWRQAEASDLPLGDASFDVVFCQQGLQFFPDRRAALSEMRRVLQPGGTVALLVWRSIRFQPVLATMLDIAEEYVDSGATAPARAPFMLGDAQDLRRLLAEAGFRDTHIQIAIREVRSPSIESEVKDVADFLGEAWANLPGETKAEYRARVTAALEPYMDDEGLTTSMAAHVVTAQRA